MTTKKPVKKVATKRATKKTPAKTTNIRRKTTAENKTPTWAATLTMTALARATIKVEADSEEDALELIENQINYGNILSLDWEISEVVEYPEADCAYEVED